MYNGSKQQLENFKKAGELGNQKIQENKQKRKEEYNKNPNSCKECGTNFSYEQKGKTFCNNSCAAKFNNKKRGARTEETKRNNKISEIKKIMQEYNISVGDLQ